MPIYHPSIYHRHTNGIAWRLWARAPYWLLGGWAARRRGAVYRAPTSVTAGFPPTTPWALRPIYPWAARAPRQIVDEVSLVRRSVKIMGSSF